MRGKRGGRELKRTTETQKNRRGRETGAAFASSLFRAGVCWVVAIDVAIGPDRSRTILIGSSFKITEGTNGKRKGERVGGRERERE